MTENKTVWSDSTKHQINELRKTIVKKKIMLGFMIDDYSLLDKRFRYVHTGIAMLIPLIGFINEVTTGSTDQTALATIVLSGVVAGMIKIKDTLKFGKMVVIAQQQTVKYKQLYQRIEREMVKHETKRESEESFIYWVNREYNNIEMADPELTHNMKKKFIALCKEKGIPYDEDMEALNNLLAEGTKELTEVIVQKTITKAADEVVTDKEVTDEENKLDTEMGVTNSNDIKEEDLKKDTDKKSVTQSVTTAESSPQPPIIDKRRRISDIRMRSTSDENDKRQYRETMKTFSTTEDMKWALDRLSDIGNE